MHTVGAAPALTSAHFRPGDQAGLADLSDGELLARCRDLPEGSAERSVIREMLVPGSSRWCAAALTID